MSHVVALCGGVGGAKLADGLARVLPPHDLSIVVNTGDDFEHLGLSISPDIDSVLYALAGVSDPVRGWGRAEESWAFMDALRGLHGQDWFNLGDRDLALHVLRTERLRAGAGLGRVTAEVAEALGIGPAVIPMSDDPVRTLVETDDGVLPFQHYFVRKQCRPAVRAIRFEGADAAQLHPDAAAALRRTDLAGVILCPSNPYLSIDPILAVPGLRALIGQARAPVIAVSPLVGGQAIKGPTTKIMRELGIANSNAAIAAHYAGLIDTLVIDERDGPTEAGMAKAPTLMATRDDRDALARRVLQLAGRLS